MKNTKDAKHSFRSPGFRFPGFQRPTYTMVPDELFDVLLPELSGAELKVLLYIIRRTFGFKKESDTISLSQMLNGIKTRDGEAKDRGVGLSKVTLLQALRSLRQNNLIVTEHRQSEEKGNEPTSYRLNIVAPESTTEAHNKETELPMVKKFGHGGGKEIFPGPRPGNLTTQQTVLQKTDKQQHVVASTATPQTSQPIDGPHPAPTGVTEALAAFGISRLTAKRLAQSYPEHYALSKVELVQFLVDTKSRLVARNPAGYLRRSIEEDYAPPKGYKPKAKREAEHRERRGRERQEAEERRRVEDQARQARSQLHAQLRKLYPSTQIPGTKLTTAAAWELVKSYLQDHLSAFQYGLLHDTILLQAENGIARIGTTNGFLCRYLSARLDASLREALNVALHRHFKPQFELLAIGPEPGRGE